MNGNERELKTMAKGMAKQSKGMNQMNKFR
jgi:hypothetical protein